MRQESRARAGAEAEKIIKKEDLVSCVYKLTSESGVTFTDDALETLVLAADEYMQEVFDEVRDVQITRQEQINDIQERLRLLKDETVKLEEESRTLQKAYPRLTMTIECLKHATERVDARGLAVKNERTSAKTRRRCREAALEASRKKKDSKD